MRKKTLKRCMRILGSEMEIYYRDEIEEAIVAADRALEALDRALDCLDGASGWGLLDMFGGGLFSTFLKHSNIEDANEAMKEAKDALNEFSRELADVDKDLCLDIDIGSFLTFADYFFDNIFTDMLVQSKIADAKKEVERAIYEVEDIKDELMSYLDRGESDAL